MTYTFKQCVLGVYVFCVILIDTFLLNVQYYQTYGCLWKPWIAYLTRDL